MSRKYLTAYAVWLAFVLTCVGIAAAWYRHVEDIGWRELAKRLPGEQGDDATG